MSRKSGSVPCFCEKCEGALKNKRTERRHRAAARNATVNTVVDDFAKWRQARTEVPGPSKSNEVVGSRSLDSSSESSGDDDPPDNLSSSSKRPTKRRRMVSMADTFLLRFFADC